MNFKVGDTVEIVKMGYGAGYKEFLGLRGYVLRLFREHISYVAVVFDEESVQKLKYEGCEHRLHNLNGAIKSNTGRYIGLSCLRLVEEEVDEL